MKLLGSDIVMCLNEFGPCKRTRALAESSALSMRCAARSRDGLGEPGPGHAAGSAFQQAG